MTAPRPFAASAAAALVTALAAAVLAAAPADLYGKPLRGLTPVSVAAIVAAPERYTAKAVRVEGKNSGAAGQPALKDGDSVLPIVTDGSFSLPAGLEGGTLAAEGKARSRDGRAEFVATGVEVRGVEVRGAENRR